MRMKNNSREGWTTLCTVLLGGGLVALVFLSPDTGHAAHKSFFSVAYQAHWSRHSNLAAAWCSVKIILLGLGVFLIVDALGNLAIRVQQEVLGMVVLFLGIVPVWLCVFGSYELVKTVV
jgi:hypothetical protein